MSFLTATNTELIYNMDGAGSDITVSTVSFLTQSNGSALAGAYIPPVFSIWQPSSVVGKGFRVILAGTYDCAAQDGFTFKYGLNTTQGNTTFAQALVTTGSSNIPLGTANSFYAQFDITFSAVSGSGNLSGYVNGFLLAGASNNAGTSQTVTGNVTMLGGSTSSGASTTTFTSWLGPTAYWWEATATVSTAPTHMALQEHQIYGLN